jgi:NAD+ synthase (glutamine-hydrolysing)
MRVALAQINPTVGDIQGNLALVMDAVARAEEEGASFTLMPELVLTGYPPEDLLAKDHFIEDQLIALEQVAAACGHSAIVGFVDRVDDKLFNAAALCGNGRVMWVYHKRMLPNYGVFDERRYFQRGEEPGVFELGGTMFGVTICEDIWVPELVAEQATLGAEVLFNVSASPYHEGRGAEREEMLQERARTTGNWLAYCNLVGGQDELVYDGRSVVIAPDGSVVARGKSFATDFLVADFAPAGKLGASGQIAEQLGAQEDVYGALVLGVRDYFRKNGFTDAVLGLSGGIDSALTATIAADALGPKRVHAVLMPSRYSSEGSIVDSRALVERLGIDVLELSVEGPFQAYLDLLEPVFSGTESDVTEENLQARVRGAILMALSNKFGWLTLATGNKSELSVGYSTLYGDMVGGFAPIKDVPKTRAYELARWLNRDGERIPEAILAKPPSAELRPGQTDQDSLPPYDVLDDIVGRYVEDDASVDDIVAAGHDRATVERVAGMVDRSEYKRRQGPTGIRVTPKAFGRDRRMPITNRYTG